MKYLKILYLVLFSLYLVSCQRENPIINQSTPIGRNWELHSAKVFVDNLNNGEKIYYDHFGPNRRSSNLDIFSPNSYKFDMITSGKTTWRFSSASTDFFLDDYPTYQYNYLNTGSIFNVFGLENGSARPIEILSCTDNELYVKVYKGSGTDGSYTYNFYTIMTFVEAGSTTPPKMLDVPYNYSYGGVFSNGNVVGIPNLVGTIWILNKFIQNAQTIYTSDTISFISGNKYKIGNSIEKEYYLSPNVVLNMRVLTLYQFTPLSGDWEGRIQPTFLTDGKITNADFNDILVSSRRASLFLNRIK